MVIQHLSSKAGKMPSPSLSRNNSVIATIEFSILERKIMHRRSLFFVSLSMSVLLFPVHSSAQPCQSCMKPGDILPPLAGEALTGKWLDIRSVVIGNPAVVIFSFSRAGGVMVIGATGRVQWMTAGPFAEALYSEFSRSIQALY